MNEYGLREFSNFLKYSVQTSCLLNSDSGYFDYQGHNSLNFGQFDIRNNTAKEYLDMEYGGVEVEVERYLDMEYGGVEVFRAIQSHLRHTCFR